jgi:hypothetical protein
MPYRLRQLVAILALVAPGCAADQMRFTAIRLAARVPESYQAQVMENLARAAANPGSMLYLSRLFNGTASTTDTATGAASLTSKPHSFTGASYGLNSISRNVQANIGLAPIDNPDKLAAMQVAYQLVIAPQTVTQELYTSCLAPFLKGKSLCVASIPPPGWLHIGGKHDVPRGAADAAHCGKTSVWVMPEDVDALTQFIYFILNIASEPSTRPAATGAPPPGYGAPTIPERESPPDVNFNLLLVPRP